jgi:hypothetical protein
MSASKWNNNKSDDYLSPRPCRSLAVRRWLPTTAARVRVRAACGVCGGQSGTGAGFLRVLRFFFYLDYETIGTAATPGLLCQPRVIMKMMVESMMECRLAGETEVLGENLPQSHFGPSQNPRVLRFPLPIIPTISPLS